LACLVDQLNDLPIAAGGNSGIRMYESEPEVLEDVVETFPRDLASLIIPRYERHHA
jgi:hypothetical protein